MIFQRQGEIMTGIIDAGGGMRGAYTAGIYDYLLDNKIRFFSIDLLLLFIF